MQPAPPLQIPPTPLLHHDRNPKPRPRRERWTPSLLPSRIKTRNTEKNRAPTDSSLPDAVGGDLLRRRHGGIRTLPRNNGRRNHPRTAWNTTSHEKDGDWDYDRYDIDNDGTSGSIVSALRDVDRVCGGRGGGGTQEVAPFGIVSKRGDQGGRHGSPELDRGPRRNVGREVGMTSDLPPPALPQVRRLADTRRNSEQQSAPPLSSHPHSSKRCGGGLAKNGYEWGNGNDVGGEVFLALYRQLQCTV